MTDDDMKEAIVVVKVMNFDLFDMYEHAPMVEIETNGMDNCKLHKTSYDLRYRQLQAG